jgi:hypothetical protein
MSKEPEMEMVLYTLCLEGTAIAICALEVEALTKDPERTIRDAFFETWGFGGGDLMQLVGRAMMARPPTRKESNMWHVIANETGKPYVVLGGGGEARGRRDEH